MRNTILILITIVLVILVGYWLMVRSVDAPYLSTGTSDEQMELEATLGMPTTSRATLEAGSYTADTERSVISWQAGKPAISGYVHNGTFALRSGAVEVSEEALQGEFVVDINSIKVTSLGGGKSMQESVLEAHLKGEGFFNADVHPAATFRITDISPKELPGPERSDYTATGQLTMKGQTKAISFPIKVTVAEEDEVWMNADIELDRTEWGISFGSAKIVERITEQVIGDTVNLSLVVRLTK